MGVTYALTFIVCSMTVTAPVTDAESFRKNASFENCKLVQGAIRFEDLKEPSPLGMTLCREELGRRAEAFNRETLMRLAKNKKWPFTGKVVRNAQCVLPRSV